MTTADHVVDLDLATALASRGLELGPVIGRGAISVVYRAHDAKHDRPLAVKVLDVDTANEIGTEWFTREIGALAKLRHPNILPLIDSGTTARGDKFFLMPLAEGETLRVRLDRGPLPLADAVRYAREIGEALGHAHAEGFLHRDVKPENILLEHGHAILADFGLTRRTRPAPDQSTVQTQVDLVVGTPAYMSPEQLAPGGSLDGRTDLFSLGVTLYEMLTGELPFRLPTMPGLLTERLAGRFKPVGSLRPGVPGLLERIVARALAPDPAERYDRAESMVADLTLVERQLSRTARSRTLRRRPRWTRIGGGVAALLATVVLLLRPHELRRSDHRIVVAEIWNETGDPALAVIGSMAADLISAGLTTIPALTVLNGQYVFGAPPRNLTGRPGKTSASGLRALVDSAHASTVVSGSYYRDSAGLLVFAQVTDAKTGRLLLALGPLRGSLAQPEPVLATLRDSIVTFLRRGR